MKKKDKFYFSHDSNARRDPKMIALIADHGFAGYGRFFAIIEMLRESEDYKMDLSKKYLMRSLASELKLPGGECQDLINSLSELELLETDGIFVWSKSLDERMAIYDKKRNRMSELARIRWDGTKQKNKKNEDETAEKSSEKKTKSKPFASIEALRSDKIFAEIKADIRTKEKYNVFSDKDIESKRDSVILWLESKKKVYKNYKSMFLGCLNRDIDDKGLDNKSEDEEMVY